MLKRIIAALLLTIGLAAPAKAIDASCTQTTNLQIYDCPENSIDWYQSYENIVDGLDRLAKTAISSFTVQGNAFSVGASTLVVASGRLGLGTTSPEEKLHIAAGAIALDNTREIRWKDASSNLRTLLAFDASNILQIGHSSFNTNLAGAANTVAGDTTFNGGSGALCVNESDGGNCGINAEANTTRGLIELKQNGITTGQLSGGSEDQILPNNLIQGGGLFTGGNTNAGVTNDGTSTRLVSNDGVPIEIRVVDAQDFLVKTDNTERMRIESGGDVGIGTTNPIVRLHVAAATDAGMLVRAGDSTDNSFYVEDGAGAKDLFKVQADGTTSVNGSTLTVTSNGRISAPMQPGARARLVSDATSESLAYTYLFPGDESGNGNYDRGHVHDATNSSGTFTAKGAGLYHVQAQVVWAGNATGTRNVFCESTNATPGSGTGYCNKIMDVGSANVLVQGCSALVELADGATVSCGTRQDSGGALNRVGSLGTFVQIQKIW